jgi:regulator of protease activity HflC (stomatin/prohibitin superfamily)
MIIVSCSAGEEVLIERGGRHVKTITRPGMHLKAPFDRAVHVSTLATREETNVVFKTRDNVFAALTIAVTRAVTDSKAYHYEAMDAGHQANLLIQAAAREQLSTLGVVELGDCGQALDSVLKQVKPQMDRLGIDILSIGQVRLDLPSGVADALAAAGVALRTPEDKARDAEGAKAAMTQGLDTDVKVRKPLAFKKR